MFVFPKKVTLLIIAKQNVQYDLLHPCLTPQLSLLLFHFVAFHYDMTKWNLLGRSFPLKGLVQSSKNSQRKRKSLQHHRAKCIKWKLYGKYYKMSASKNYRSRWPARWEFDRSVHDQAGLCPLTGCNLKPCHSQSQVWHFKRYGTSQENCSVNTRVGAICGFSTCKLLATNMLVKFYMNGHRQHTIQLKNKQPTRVNHTGIFAFTQIC